MSFVRKGLLAVVLSVGFAWGCSGTSSDDASTTDDDQLELDEAARHHNGRGPRNADCDGPPRAPGKPGVDAGRPPRPDPGTTTPPPTSEPDEDAGIDEPPPTTEPDEDAGTTTPPPTTTPDAGTKPPSVSIGGTATANSCSSTAAPSGGKCGSYFCGVTESDIAASLPADSLCPDPAMVCEGRLVGVISGCTRSTVIANLGTPVASLTPQIQTCVYKDAQFKEKVTSGCLGCFMKAAECAVNKCLTECLADGPACDSCRIKNNCDQTVFDCAKLPNPF